MSGLISFEVTTEVDQKHRSQKKTRVWLFRFLAILLALAPFAIIEVTLRAFDLPRSLPAADPFVDLHNLSPLFDVDPEHPNLLRIASDRLNLFKPAAFEIPKPGDTLRVFALGGSTTQGEPYSTPTAFPAWMGICLQAATGRNVEVVNCGGLSYASYRVLAILREMVRLRARPESLSTRVTMSISNSVATRDIVKAALLIAREACSASCDWFD